VRAPAWDVIGVGANSLDLVLRIPVDMQSLSTAGKVRIAEERLFGGGQTATTLSACAALGLTTSYIGAFGSGGRGARMRSELNERGVGLTHAVRRRVPNAGAAVIVDNAGQRTVIWTRDERLGLAPGEIDAAVLRSSRIIHVDDVDPPAALRTCHLARDLGVPVTSDLEQVDGRTEELVAAVTHPIFDQNVPGVLTGEQDPERALRKLRRLNPGVLCMTLGDRGAAALDEDRFLQEPALKVDVVDTTGAGDVFRAGFIYGWLQEWDVARCLRFANAAAAVSCTRLGAIASVPSLADVEMLLGPGGNGVSS
jgi:sulfofructose kinase